MVDLGGGTEPTEVADGLYIGSQECGDALAWSTDWAIVHACKEPYHRDAVGYVSPGAPKDHPEYLFARRERRLALNFIDANSARFIHHEMIDATMEFMDDAKAHGLSILVHCNQGKSRSPAIAMLYMAPQLSADVGEAMLRFRELYPGFQPGAGVLDFVSSNWSKYHERKSSIAAEPFLG